MSSKDSNNPIPPHQQYGYTDGATSPAEQARIDQQKNDAAQNHLNNQYGGAIVVPQPTQLGNSPGPNSGNDASLNAAETLSQGHASAKYDALAASDAPAASDDKEVTPQSGGRKRRTYRKRRGGKRRTYRKRRGGKKTRKQRRRRRTRRLRTRGKPWGCFSGGVKNKFRSRSRRRITRKYRK